MPDRNIPQTTHELKQFSKIEVTIMTHFHAVSDGRLLESVEQSVTLPIDEELRSTLRWTVEEHGVSLSLALGAYLVTWLEQLAAEPEVQQEICESYAHLPKYHVSFHLSKPPTWIQAND
jgi:hypothetical protein